MAGGQAGRWAGWQVGGRAGGQDPDLQAIVPLTPNTRHLTPIPYPLSPIP